MGDIRYRQETGEWPVFSHKILPLPNGSPFEKGGWGDFQFRKEYLLEPFEPSGQRA